MLCSCKHHPLRADSVFTAMNKLREVVIVSACRTPIGAFGGSLKDVKGPVLAQTVMQEALKRAKVDGSVVGLSLFRYVLLHTPPSRSGATRAFSAAGKYREQPDLSHTFSLSYVPLTLYMGKPPLCSRVHRRQT